MRGNLEKPKVRRKLGGGKEKGQNGGSEGGGWFNTEWSW